MTERMVTTSRDALADNLSGFLDRWWTPEGVADRLIDSGVVRVVDPDDPELVERAVRALHDADGPDGAWSKLDDAQRNFWLRGYARAAIEAVLS